MYINTQRTHSYLSPNDRQGWKDVKTSFAKFDKKFKKLKKKINKKESLKIENIFTI